MNLLVSNYFFDTLNKNSSQKELLKKRLLEFIKLKESSPFNGAAPDGTKFGSSDKPFVSGGKFSSRVANISHAHLTHDVSIVYRVTSDRSNIELYGVYTHDDIGTGNPPNINRRDQAATKWSNTEFNTVNVNAMANSLKPKEKPVDTAPATKTSKPDYAPKTKTAPTVATQPSDNINNLAREVSAIWPQRNFYNQMSAAQSKNERLAVINSEVSYLNTLRQRAQLYPNQVKYLQALNALFNFLKKST